MAASHQVLLPSFILLISSFLLINITYANPTRKLDKTVQFTYTGAKGPNHWGNLSPNYSECSLGKWQSPINIVKDKVVIIKNLKPLIREYHPANATLANNGFNIGIRFEGDAGFMTVDGKNYSLIQVHWHSPSEHRINGVQYDAEFHQVHKADDGSLSVVATLYHYGHPDPLVSKILKNLDVLAKEERKSHEQGHIILQTFYTKQTKPKTRKYYKYKGSLTTPPCSQNVTWTILGKVRSISREQVEALKAPLLLGCKNNSRPVQALDNREVEEYEELTMHG